MNKKDRERKEAIEELRKILKVGDRVYTNVVHVSRSGMLRVIDAIIIRNNQPRHIAYLASSIRLEL